MLLLVVEVALSAIRYSIDVHRCDWGVTPALEHPQTSSRADGCQLLASFLTVVGVDAAVAAVAAVVAVVVCCWQTEELSFGPPQKSIADASDKESIVVAIGGVVVVVLTGLLHAALVRLR